MAIVKCPACFRRTSDAWIDCEHCGRGIDASFEWISGLRTPLEQRLTKPLKPNVSGSKDAIDSAGLIRMIGRSPIAFRVGVAMVALRIIAALFSPIYRVVDVPSFIPCIRLTIMLLLCGQLVEPRLGRKHVLTLLIGSVLYGAAIYVLYDKGYGFVSPSPIVAAYVAGYLVCWLRFRKELRGWAHIGAAYFGLALTLWILGPITTSLPLFGGVALGAGIYTYRILPKTVPQDSRSEPVETVVVS